MSEPFLAEIRMVSFNFPPRGWAMCDGQLLPINQNQALFSLLGTTYGGNGITTFALPDLRGRIPIHPGNSFVLGQRGGEEAHTLTTGEIPAHTHAVTADPGPAGQAGPAANFFANGGSFTTYGDTPTEAMAPQAVNATGGGQPHGNVPPYTVITFVIALQGIFPSRN